MKHKTNYITRIYTYLYLLEQDLFFPNKLPVLNKSINPLFLEVFQVTETEINLEFFEKLVNYNIEENEKINNIREKFQDRNSIVTENSLIVLINLAIGEFLQFKTPKQLVIKVYVDIISLFHNGTNFVHGVLDKSLTYLEQIEKEQKMINN